MKRVAGKISPTRTVNHFLQWLAVPAGISVAAAILAGSKERRRGRGIRDREQSTRSCQSRIMTFGPIAEVGGMQLKARSSWS